MSVPDEEGLRLIAEKLAVRVMARPRVIGDRCMMRPGPIPSGGNGSVRTGT